jgi:transcriptional regulator with XRE-family HTH domain
MDSGFVSNLAQRLIKSRIDKGLSQQELAKLSGVSQQTISSIESGKIKSSRFVADLAGALEVNLEWLMTGNELDVPDGGHAQHIIAIAQEQIRGIIQADVLVKCANDQINAALNVHFQQKVLR